MIVYACPKCGGKDLQFSVMTTHPQLEHFNVTECSSCGWREEKRDEIERIPYKTTTATSDVTLQPSSILCKENEDENKLKNQESSDKDVLDNVLDKIKAEIMDCLRALDEIEKSGLNIYLPNEISGRRLTYKQCLEFVDKYKSEKENKK